jgi:hypothetical protein
MTWTNVTQEVTPVEVEATPAERLEASYKTNTESMAKIAHALSEGKTKQRMKTKPDLVNNPPHYTVGGIETIDYIKAKLTPEEFIGYLKGNVIKYTSRAGKKDDVIQDLEKAQWYMNRQIKELKGESK